MAEPKLELNDSMKESIMKDAMPLIVGTVATGLVAAVGMAILEMIGSSYHEDNFGGPTNMQPTADDMTVSKVDTAASETDGKVNKDEVNAQKGEVKASETDAGAQSGEAKALDDGASAARNKAGAIDTENKGMMMS